MKRPVFANVTPGILILSGGWTAMTAFVEKYLFSDFEFLTWLSIVVLLDLITGVAKVWVRQGGKAVTSAGMRMTLTKFIQYGAFLIVTHVLINFTIEGQRLPQLGFIDNWAYGLLILIEIKSVYENITAIDPRLDVLRPLLKRLSTILKTFFHEKDPGNQ